MRAGGAIHSAIKGDPELMYKPVFTVIFLLHETTEAKFVVLQQYHHEDADS